MEKDNKSLPMRVFSNTMSSFPIETRNIKATTSLLQQTSHRHAVHPRLVDVQISSNEIIDLTSASPKEMLPMNLNAQARPTNINNSIMNVNGKNLDVLHGISKGNQTRIALSSLKL